MDEVLARAILTADLPMVVVDDDGTVVAANAAARTHFGPEVIGSTAARAQATGDLAVAGRCEGGRLLVFMGGVAIVDALTGIPNRRALGGAVRGLPPEDHSIALLDLDGFKEINDALGHHAGDRVLVVAARVLSESVDGTWFRFGGDEFAVIVPGRPEHAAAQLEGAIDRVRQASSAEFPGHVVTFSAGVTSLVEPLREALLSADASMWHAKHSGRARVVVHGTATQAFLEGRKAVAATVERLEQESRTDVLTGLPNRAALDDRHEVLDRSLTPHAVLFLDADRFGRLNHHRGDAAGDDALRALAGVLRDQCRAGDAYRKGGEEFVVVLPGAGRDAAVAVAERLRAAVEALAVPHGGAPDTPVLTVTVGVAVGAGAAEALVDAAARRAYAGKEAGRRNAVHAG